MELDEAIVFRQFHHDMISMAASAPGPGRSVQAIIGSLSGRRVFIETYGCTYNQGDSQKLAEILRNRGIVIVKKATAADVIIINTCCVVGSTERRMLKALRGHSGKELYVTGCLPLAYPSLIPRDAVAGILYPDDIHVEYCRITPITNSSIGIVQIARGCRGRCSYCITRRARGALESYPIEYIVDQVRRLTQSGAVEIRLTAQDVSAWGLDRKETLPDLLNAITDVNGNFMVRVGMMNPATAHGILDDLVDAYSHRKIFRFVHLPVQSGSDSVLERMGRDYSVSDFTHIVGTFRRSFPDITVVIDMIVGFPEEGPDDFARSLSLIREISPNKVNITRFSARPGTPAVGMKNIIDRVKKERSRQMQDDCNRVYKTINSREIGSVVPVLITERVKSGSVMGRTPSYAGVVIKGDLGIGYSGLVALREEHGYYFTGELVSREDKL